MLKTLYRCVVLFLGLCLPTFLSAEGAFTPIAGQSYKVMPALQNTTQQPSSFQLSADKTVTVLEFFSYGCPACAHFEPTLEAWLASKPNYVTFKRIPVIFERGWMALAAAYYTAERLKVTDKVSPAIFKAIWVDHQDVSNEAALAMIFQQAAGIPPAQFKETYEFAPQMAAQVFNSQALMSHYKIEEIPTLLIDGKYKTSVVMAGSPEQTIQTLNYVITQAAKEKGLVPQS